MTWEGYARVFLTPVSRMLRMRIQDLLPSNSLAELLQMRALQSQPLHQDQNWFHVASAASVYETFNTLDVDKSHSLSQTEFAG